MQLLKHSLACSTMTKCFRNSLWKSVVYWQWLFGLDYLGGKTQQGILTEEDGSVQLTSSYQLVQIRCFLIPKLSYSVLQNKLS